MEFFASLENSALSTWIRESNSILAYDLFLISHAIGMAIVVGLSAAFALRLLGFAEDLPLAPMEKFFPLMYAGFWINAASGVVLFVTYPVRAVTNLGFYLKMGSVALAMVALVRLRRLVFRHRATLDKAPVPANAKTLAGALLFFWWAAVLAGRLLAYHGIANVELQATIAVSAASALMLLARYAIARS